jgi:ribosome-binding protein aMBF1 (putative translation factor)
MLITGGLIVLGVLFLVAVFLIGRGDNTARQANSAGAVHTTPGTAPDQPPVATTPAKVEGHAPQETPAPETQPILANGQIHELIGQLQKLQEQSQELARRLELLNAMVRRIEEGEALR